MSVTGSCGHKFTEEEGMGNHLLIQDSDRRGDKAVSSVSVCDACAEWHRENGVVFKNEEAADEWLLSEKPSNK